MIVGHRDRAAETTVTGLIAQDVRAHNMICTCLFELQSCCKQWYISSLLYQNMLLQLCDLLRCGMQHMGGSIQHIHVLKMLGIFMPAGSWRACKDLAFEVDASVSDITAHNNHAALLLDLPAPIARRRNGVLWHLQRHSTTVHYGLHLNDHNPDGCHKDGRCTTLHVLQEAQQCHGRPIT